MNKIKAMVEKINKHCENLEFAEARRMIEFNLEQLSNTSYYFMLTENVKVLLKHVLNQENSDTKPLTRLELLKINEINKYCTEFDISMLKRTLRNSLNVLQRPDIDSLLNQDAKTILQSMGAFIVKEVELSELHAKSN